MKYNIVTAAKLTGKTKAAISRDVQEGKISANKLEDGSYEIEPSELERVYTMRRPPSRSRIDPHPSEDVARARDAIRDVEQLREQLAMMQAERERERTQLLDQIADLRRRLDAEADERRQLTLSLLPKPLDTATPLPVPAHHPGLSDRSTPIKPKLAGLLDRLRALPLGQGLLPGPR